MKRTVFRIHWHTPSGRWRVSVKRKIEAAFNTQETAVGFATFEANQFWRVLNHPAQVILHGKDGRIRWERTYGRDPKRRKG